MKTHSSFYPGLHNPKFFHIVKTRNELQIRNVKIIKDKNKEQLFILLESDRRLEQDINAFIQGNNIIIEALRSMDMEKPFRTHLIEKEIISDFDKGGLEIGFSEIKLNDGYKYEILAYQRINLKLIKVILSYQVEKKPLDTLLN